MASSPTVHIIPALQDNYIYVVENDEKEAFIVDPGEAEPVLDFLQKHHLTPKVILLTHHHWDHVSGIKEIKNAYPDLWLYAPGGDTKRLPLAPDVELKDQDVFTILGFKMQAIHVPGHTHHHLCLYFQNENLLFSGDTLFSIGCGRVFEGTMAQMHHSLQSLKALPDDTHIYCGHEYTLANIEFALSVAGNNADLRAKLEEKLKEVQTLRDAGKPTLPNLLGEEKHLNPFLSAKDEGEFERLRHQKDSY